MKTSFIIVADRGNLKAFRVEAAGGERQPRLALVQSLSFTEAHTKISEVNTDMAGRFPAGSTLSTTGAGAGGGGGRHQAAIAETQQALETDRRIIKQIAEHVATILHQERPRSWGFAAPAAINSAVLERLDAPLRKSMSENHSVDLVNMDPAKLAGHFTIVAHAGVV